ncbi:M20 family metallopeptidase [Roseivirga sp. BDSF3-8]|uniref:M20 metallopeptidase family protein n=1 Tax=Roseivirga sp. BDSF3-8 TaxID=3241598 RepID=UPI003531F57D
MRKFVLYLLIGFSLFSFQSAVAQTAVNQENNTMHQAIRQRTDQIYDSLVAIRRDFHRHPEVAENEAETSQKIIRYLKELGLEVLTDVGGYGVVGILHGSEGGKSIAWRADIDAMASDFPDVVDFASENEGVRHICGHDVHTTVAMGIANVLASQKDHIRGTVYFVFQPSEENIKGAKAMIDDGLFDLIKPDETYALHISPFPAGTIAAKAGNMYADYKKIDILLDKNDNSAEAISAVKEIIRSIENKRSPDAFDNRANLGHPEMGVMNPNTIYKDYLSLDATIRVKEGDSNVTINAYMNSSDDEQLKRAKELLTQKLRSFEYKDLVQSIDFHPITYTVKNDPALVNKSLESISTIYGSESVVPLYGVLAGNSDDFALFQEQVPGVYFFLGGSDYSKGVISMPHTPGFQVDESSIKIGVQYFSSLIVERLDGR